MSLKAKIAQSKAYNQELEQTQAERRQLPPFHENQTADFQEEVENLLEAKRDSSESKRSPP